MITLSATHRRFGRLFYAGVIMLLRVNHVFVQFSQISAKTLALPKLGTRKHC